MPSVLRLSALLAATAAAALAIAAAPAAASWTVAPGAVLPNPGETTGVACVTATACLLVGDQSSATSGATGLAFTWNGTALAQVPTASATASPASVSCVSATFCMAAGYDLSGAAVVPHAELWNGTRFTITPMPLPTGGPIPQPWDVACASATSCWAIGGMTTASGHDLPFLERWNGSSWSLASLTLPAGAVDASLGGVSCPTTVSCVAVGWYATATSAPQTLAETYNGSAWTPQTPPNPSGATSSQLLDVTCDAAARCMAVGSYDDASSVQHMLADPWNGSSWTAGPMPNPWTVLDGVACVTSPAYSCEAVGYTTAPGASVAPIANRFNGTSWALQAVAVPVGTTDNALYDIACATSTSCVAVGASTYSTLTGTRPWTELGP